MSGGKRGGSRHSGADGAAETGQASAPQPSPRQGGDRQPGGDTAFIARQALFEGVAPEVLGPLLARCEIRALEAGDVLLAPGQTNRNLYLVLDGRFKVHIERVDSAEGFFIEPGECTGEISIIDGKPATAFVVAEVPSRLLVIPEEMLWEELPRIPGVTKNFMRLLAARFRARNQAMQTALEQQLRYEHLQRELGIAHDIQLGMLPHNLELDPRVEIAAEMTPALQIGGDFYDAFPISSDQLCVAIGDVSGKGVPAALFMVRTMSLLRTELLKAQSLDRALRHLNGMLCEENPTCMFATLICGILDLRTGVFRYANAGHDPILFGEHGAGFRQLPAPQGILLGINPSATYEVRTFNLAADDVLLLYTDGVTEAMNPQHELFSLQRLAVCLDSEPVSAAKPLVDRIDRAVKEFAAGAPPSDDLTLLIVRYRGPGLPAPSSE